MLFANCVFLIGTVLRCLSFRDLDVVGTVPLVKLDRYVANPSFIFFEDAVVIAVLIDVSRDRPELELAEIVFVAVIVPTNMDV